MAVVAILAGGVFGFLGAVLALVGLQVSFVSALGIWWAVGSLCAVLLLAATLLPARKPQATLATSP